MTFRLMSSDVTISGEAPLKRSIFGKKVVDDPNADDDNEGE